MVRTNNLLAVVGVISTGIAGINLSFGQEEIPLGFQVLGSTVPIKAESPPIPSGWKERMPEANTVMPHLSAEEESHGYVLFVTSYLEPVYPSTCPLRENIPDHTDIFAAPGGYEIATFALRALREMEDVSLEATDLRRSGGGRIRSENIEIRTVRCMPRRVWAKNAYIVRPVLLEKREQVNIKKGTTQQFWITVWVPSDALHGQYSGEVRIRAKGVEARAFRLGLKVLPIRLLHPPTFYGMYYNAVDLGSGPHFKSLPSDRIRKDILNMKEHGMNTLFISVPPVCQAFKKNNQVEFDLEPLRPLVTACREAGFERVIYNIVLSELMDNPVGDYQTMLSAWGRGFQKRGWSLPVCSVGDEEDAHVGKPPTIVSRARMVKKGIPGALTFETIVFPENSEVFEPVLDIRAFSSYMDIEAAKRTRKAGRGLWMYSGTAAQGLYPKGDRLYWGAWAGKLALNGVLAWTYYRPMLDINQPFNDLVAKGSTRGNCHGWCFPGEDGPLPTIGWEATRQGIYDGKYIFTLKTLIKKASKSKEKDLSKLAEEAEAYLNQAYRRIDASPRKDNSYFVIRRAASKIEAKFFDQFRWEIAQYIIELNKGLAAAKGP